MTIPSEIKFVIKKLQEAGFEAYIVGGCVRDFLLAQQSESEEGRGVEPEDWDVATNAKPEEIRKVFPKSFYENKFLTVTVQTESQDPKLKEIEITTYRLEAKYTDKRHPDQVKFAKTIEEDLARRDFTVNAFAFGFKTQNPKSKVQTKPKTQSPKSKINSRFILIDLFGGQEDLRNKIIRAVGNPEDRFNEDALRMLRAVRFAATLGKEWQIEPKTEKAIQKNAALLRIISNERIRDEFIKIIMAPHPYSGIELLRQTGLLKFIVPELEEGWGVAQNKHHIYEVYEHALLSLKYAAQQDFNKYVRLAALFHDIAKPRVKQGDGPDATFYNHEVVGTKMTIRILSRLKFPKKDIEKIAKLVRYHLFYYNVGEVSEASVRKLVRRVGPENMEELLQVRMCDRIGSGVPKAEPYKLRHLKYVIEKASQDPISVKMLKVNGDDVMRILNIQPGPAIGSTLDILLGEVLDQPKHNTKEFLEKKIQELSKQRSVMGVTKGVSEGVTQEKTGAEQEFLSYLEKLAKEARKKRDEITTKKDEMTKKKYWVT